ncbi:MAG: DUF3108 domain-containing protein [Acidobacteriota bacterium]|nr:DUF3108 domain-containing protein [Acidobacteriota bacterium]
MTMKKLILPLLIILSVSCISIFAQAVPKSEPYKLGESLSYEGKFSKAILRGIEVASLNFTVENTPPGKNYLVKSEAKSKGTLTKLFRFRFYQTIQSTVDGEKFRILKTVKHDEQDDRVRDSQAIFDYRDKKVIYVETDPQDLARPPRKVATRIEEDTQDFITGIYKLRSLPLAVGKTFELNITDSGLIYKIPVRVTAREQQKSILGKTWCFRVEPEVFGADRLIDNKGNMIIWITDDTRRIPVRSQINTGIGRIEVRLKQIQFIKQNSSVEP